MPNRLLFSLTLLLSSPLFAWAKDEEPVATPQTPFMVGYMFVGLFVVLGIMAIVRSTTRAADED